MRDTAGKHSCNFQSKTLVGYKASTLSESNLSNSVDNQEQYLMTFNEFNSRATKNKVFMDTYLSYVSVAQFPSFIKELHMLMIHFLQPLTVKEMFVKQLVQINGLTVEKACAITDSYQTPKM